MATIFNCQIQETIGDNIPVTLGSEYSAKRITQEEIKTNQELLEKISTIKKNLSPKNISGLAKTENKDFNVNIKEGIYIENKTTGYKSYTFNGIKSLKDIALGTGIGLRYDFDFFVFRIDLGYKTYNPAKEQSERWFRDINFSRTVLNFGINYPF